MSSVLEIVFRAPESSVDVNHQRMGFSGTSRNSHIDELIRIRPVLEPEICRWWLPRKNIFRHGNSSAQGGQGTTGNVIRSATLRSDRDWRRVGRAPSHLP